MSEPTVAAPAAPTHLLYLHGFRSSPASFKARRLLGWLAAHRRKRGLKAALTQAG